MPSAAAQSRVVTSDVIYLIHWRWLVDCGGGCIQQTVKSSSKKCGVFHLERRRRRRFSIHLSGDRPTYTVAAVRCAPAGSKNRSIIIIWMLMWLPETSSFLAGPPPPPSNNKRTVTHDNDNQPTKRHNDALCAEFLLQMTVIVLW